MRLEILRWLAHPNLSVLAPPMSTQQALALPSPAPSNTVVINARCSVRIEGDQRVIVVAGLPVHHYRAEDAIAEAYAMVFLVESGFAQQTDVARAFERSVRTVRRYEERITNAKPIEANKNQSVDGAEGLFLRSGSPQNVYLLPQHPNFHLERCPQPKQICDHPNNEPDKISHPARASPDSRSTASQIEFATGTGVCVARIIIRHVRREVRRCALWHGGVCARWIY
jgi:hypothetical protein